MNIYCYMAGTVAWLPSTKRRMSLVRGTDMTESKLLVLSLLTNDYMHSVVDLVRHGSLKEPINISSKSD